MVTFEEYVAGLVPFHQREARRLDPIFREVTGWEPWVSSQGVGYGRYTYGYESGRTGVAPATGFRLRVRDVSLQIMPGYGSFPEIAARLGPHKRGKACWYIKGVEAVDARALRDLIAAGLEDLRTHWPVEPT